MKTSRVELLRDTLIKGKPMKKGTVISVDGHLYAYLDSCLCIKDAEPETKVAPATAAEVTKPTKTQGKK